MTKSLKQLLKFIPSGTTEGELGILGDVFVPPTELAEILGLPRGNPRLLVGNKGTGKTAILEFLYMQLAARGIPCILLRPDDLVLPNETIRSLADAKRHAYAELVLAAAGRLGRDLTYAGSDAEVELVRAAKARGERGLDLVERAARLLIPVGVRVANIDFSSWISEPDPQEKALGKALGETLAKDEDRFFFVLIDDIDQIGDAGETDYLTRIWGLLLGVRKLASENQTIRAVVSLRSEIWMRLEWGAKGHRDQVDHFLPLIYRLAPEDSDVENIVRSRLRVADPPGKLDQFFATKDVELPGSRQRRLWLDFLTKYARGRPRDALQLLRELATAAARSKDPRIESKHVDRVMSSFSRKRVELIAEEYQADCPQLQEIIRGLKALEFVLPSEELFNHLAKLPSAFSIRVRGEQLRPERRADVFTLWRLLHEAGVVNGLVSDERERRGFRNVNYPDDPELASPSRWNELSTVNWEVHPVFRQYLIEEQAAEAADLGLSVAELRRRRRPKQT